MKCVQNNKIWVAKTVKYYQKGIKCTKNTIKLLQFWIKCNKVEHVRRILWAYIVVHTGAQSPVDIDKCGI